MSPCQHLRMVRIDHLDGDKIEVMEVRRRERVEMRVRMMMEGMMKVEAMEKVGNIPVLMLECLIGDYPWLWHHNSMYIYAYLHSSSSDRSLLYTCRFKMFRVNLHSYRDSYRHRCSY